jgi:signal transduction histidine kinase
LILAFVLSILMSRWISGPLQDIEQAATSLAGGEYSEIRVEGPREVKKLADSFNRMAEKVESTQKAQKDFVANVSHELKTPLTSIQGFSQAILDGAVNSKQEINKAAGIIQSEAERMNRLVLELLELARLESGSDEIKREIVQVKQLLEGVIRQFSIRAEQSNIDLEYDVGELPTCVGDPDRLVQAFSNLLDNAIKHTPPNGIVEISADQNGTEIVVTISDSGPGIPEDEINRIFERFYQIDKSRARDSQRGSGLGLAIVKQIITAHRGQISVYNNQTQGAVFEIRIPAVLSSDDTAVRYSG